MSAAARHQPESAGEKAAPAAGRMRAGTASDEEHGRYSYGKDMRGRFLQRPTDIGRMLQRRDAIRPVVDETPFVSDQHAWAPHDLLWRMDCLLPQSA